MSAILTARTAAAALLVAIAVVAAPAAPAQATGSTSDDRIVAQWDGPTTHLDAVGGTTTTIETTFVGERTVSPGDRVQRTLDLVNAGPDAGTLSLTIDVDETIPELAANPDLADQVVLFWDVAGVAGSQSFATLLRSDGGRTRVAEIQVPAGGQAPVTLGFSVDRELTADRSAGLPSTVLTFDVLVEVRGETARQAGALAITGSSVAGAVLGVVALVGAGLLLVAAARRRRCGECGSATSRSRPRCEVQVGERREALCLPCVLRRVGLVPSGGVSPPAR